MTRSVAVAASLSLLTACAEQPTVDLDAELASLREAVEAYHVAAGARDAEAIIALYASDGAAMMGPNTPDAAGTAAIRADVEGFTSLENFQFDSETQSVVVSPGGQMGYSVAIVDISWTVDGETVSDKLRDVHVWVKEDGAWKVAVDVWNSLVPLAE